MGVCWKFDGEHTFQELLRKQAHIETVTCYTHSGHHKEWHLNINTRNHMNKLISLLNQQEELLVQQQHKRRELPFGAVSLS